MKRQLADAPPLVLASECDRLRRRLAAVARGEAFLLQGGDCAETFATSSHATVRDTVATLLQMAVVITYFAHVPVVKVGRIAGQYAKPRSRPVETRGHLTLPTFRGDAVNSAEFTPQARTPDPRRMLRMYQESAITLNLLRALISSGYADLARIHGWIQHFAASSPVGARYGRVIEDVSRALRFTLACGIDPLELRTTEFFTSHEGLLLDYESALTRLDESTKLPYCASGHLLWIGERTRNPAGAHVAYFSTVRNPVAVKLGPTATPDDALRLIDKLDPRREPGRLTFITRLGANRVRDALPALVDAVRAEGAPVVWVCDPMHANTFTAPSGHKTRRLRDVLAEIQGFMQVHRSLGTHPGGIHLELTGGDVTECVGGTAGISLRDLPDHYESACDPRLNRHQALELAFLIAQSYLDHHQACPPAHKAHTTELIKNATR